MLNARANRSFFAIKPALYSASVPNFLPSGNVPLTSSSGVLAPRKPSPLARSRHAPRRMLSFLCYATSVDLAVPTPALRELGRTVIQ